ncbi:MAG: hypothetical protein OXG81_12665, partial [Acidobacteria bacterium]|nr:hypothetical protein [Acidobacteriota bacterium]
RGKTLANLANRWPFANILPRQIHLNYFEFDCQWKHVSDMALLKFFQPVKKKPDLPNPNGPLSSEVPPSAISSANTKVLEALGKSKEKTKCARGPYLALTPAQKYEIGKRAAEYGATNSIRYYSKKYPDFVIKRNQCSQDEKYLPRSHQGAGSFRIHF